MLHMPQRPLLRVGDDAVLADALATAIGNRAKDSASLRTCFEDFRHVKGLRAGLVLRDGEAAFFGAIPKMIEIEHNPERITVHSKMDSSKYTGNGNNPPEVRA